MMLYSELNERMHEWSKHFYYQFEIDVILKSKFYF